MAEILKPQMMQEILQHGKAYRRAVGLLRLDWEPASQPIYRDVLGTADIRFARQLQAAGLIHGQVDLNSYQAVAQLVGQHSQWFSAGARRTLLDPFQD